MYETLKVEKENWGYSLTFNRPEKMNALSYKMIVEIYHALENLKNKKPHILLIKGEGSSFCSGHDLNDSVSNKSVEENEDRIFKMQEITKRIVEFPAPVIASVKGYAIGAGSEIALNCDLIYVSEGSMFGFPELKLGLSITQASSFFLPRQIGLAKAKELLFFSENIPAEEFKALGLINDIFPAEEHEKKLEKKLLFIQKQSLEGLKALKKLLHHGMEHSINESLSEEVAVLKSLIMK